MSQLVEERQNIARRSDLKGSERRALLSDATDSWLRGLLTDAITQHRADSTQFALLAVGGYGRREMSLGSDIDVVLVHEPSAPPRRELSRKKTSRWCSGLSTHGSWQEAPISGSRCERGSWVIGGRVREIGSWNCTQRPWHGVRA